MKKENVEIRTSKLAIVNEAVVANNLSEVDNLESFFNSVIEELEEKIEDKTAFISELKTKNARSIKSLKKKIADAENSVTKSFISVEASKITTNAAIENELALYWERVKASQRTLKALEEELEASTISFKEESSEHTLMLKQLEDYLAKIKR
jgi:hypothetical protein